MNKLERKNLTLGEICAMTQKSHTTIRNWIKAGKFPNGTKYGWAHLWNAAEINSWLQENMKGAGA